MGACQSTDLVQDPSRLDASRHIWELSKEIQQGKDVNGPESKCVNSSGLDAQSTVPSVSENHGSSQQSSSTAQSSKSSTLSSSPCQDDAEEMKRSSKSSSKTKKKGNKKKGSRGSKKELRPTKQHRKEQTDIVCEKKSTSITKGTSSATRQGSSTKGDMRKSLDRAGSFANRVSTGRKRKSGVRPLMAPDDQEKVVG